MPSAPPDQPVPEPRVAVVADLRSERWTSMDLVADMLLSHLGASAAASGLSVDLLCPELPPSRLRHLPRGATFERYRQRFVAYPRWLARRAGHFETFHVVDHSYAHVVLNLPAARTVITCHDADAFLPLVAPHLTSSRLPLALVRRLLRGMQAAAHIACPSAATRDELLQYGLVSAERISVVPNGVHPVFHAAPDPDAAAFVAAILGYDSAVDLMHVGSCIPRKRIDRLLEIVAAVRRTHPQARLIRVGGPFTLEQRAHAERLGIADAIVTMPRLDTAQLAALYRRVRAVVLTSDREGFGIPVVEALACGTPVIATDLAVFREVGGAQAQYCPLDDTAGWSNAIAAVLADGSSAAQQHTARAERVAWARRFSWANYADAMAQIYWQLSGRADAAVAARETAEL